MPVEVRLRRSLFVPWLLFAGLCVWSMVVYPGQETIPLHLGWFALGIAYGLDAWPLAWAWGAVVGYAAVTGSVLVHRAAAGVIPGQETAEIPLMAALVILMMWHVKRRQSALAVLGRVRRREQQRAERREHMARLVSHEIRTTLTIAGGFLDLVLARPDVDDARADLEVARDELGRLNRASDRLIRMMRMQESRPRTLVDVDALLAQTLERWAAVTPRDWVLDADGGIFECEPHRLRACFDTLIENSLRYTSVSGTVRLFAFRTPDHLCLGVADSGPGFPRSRLSALNRASLALSDLERQGRHHSESGLGLGIVQEVVRERGGRVAAGRSAEGGALVVIVLPSVVPVREAAVDEVVPLTRAPAVGDADLSPLA